MSLPVPAPSALIEKRLGGNLTLLLDELGKGASRNASCAKAGIHPMRLSRLMRKAETDDCPEEIQLFATQVLAAEGEDETKLFLRMRSLADGASSEKVKFEALKFLLERKHHWSGTRDDKGPSVQIVGKLEQVIAAEDVGSDNHALQAS